MKYTLSDNVVTLRSQVRDDDPGNVREIVTSTGFFSEDEIAIAVELAEECLYRGPESGYAFIFVELEGRTVAYSCYGLIPCTHNSYDLYWIATHESVRNHGLGSLLLKATEEAIVDKKGRGIYVETASREQYAPTRKFYEQHGYTFKARFEDYYEQGDDLIYYVKRL